MTVFRTACPVVKRSLETFVDWVTVGGERKRMEFEKEILWIQQSETQVLFLHGGEVLKEGATHNDFYGYLTSMDIDHLHPDTLANRYGITPQSSLELVLNTRVFLGPAVETAETIKENQSQPANYKPTYAYVPDAWRKEVVTEEGDRHWPSLAVVDLASGPTWSSKNTPEQNAALVAVFKEAWAAPVMAATGTEGSIHA